MTTRPLHFIWIADCSGSMQAGGKIQSLNIAINEAIPAMRQVAEGCPNAEVLVRAVAFSDGASWHVARPTTVDAFIWRDLVAGGLTDLGDALALVAASFREWQAGEPGFPPVLVLLSDGQPTDDHAAGLRALLEQPWGRRSERVAIAIGRDADLDVLRGFTGDAGKVVRANNPEALARSIRSAATSLLATVAAPPSMLTETTWGPEATWSRGVPDVW
jgi:uncharacterized protein YegL